MSLRSRGVRGVAVACLALLLLLGGSASQPRPAEAQAANPLTIGVVGRGTGCKGQPVNLSFIVSYASTAGVDPAGSGGWLSLGTVDATANHGRLSERHWTFAPQMGATVRHLQYTGDEDEDVVVTLQAQYDGYTAESSIAFRVIPCRFELGVIGNAEHNQVEKGETGNSLFSFYSRLKIQVISPETVDPNPWVKGEGTYSADAETNGVLKSGPCSTVSKGKGEGPFKVVGQYLSKEHLLDLDLFASPVIMGGVVVNCASFKNGPQAITMGWDPMNGQFLGLKIKPGADGVSINNPDFIYPPPFGPAKGSFIVAAVEVK